MSVEVHPKKVDKMVVDTVEFSLCEMGELTQDEINEWIRGIQEFRDVGIILRELGEAY